jgi:hypothetical protein
MQGSQGEEDEAMIGTQQVKSQLYSASLFKPKASKYARYYYKRFQSSLSHPASFNFADRNFSSILPT